MPKGETPKSEKTKGRILAAAVALFSKKGFHGTKVDEIALKARINKERLYAYFGGKESLFEAALENVYAESASCDRGLLKLGEGDIPSLTSMIVSHYMGMYRRRPAFWRMIAWANLESAPLPETIRNAKGESLDHLRKLYAKGQGRGTFHKGLPFEAYIYMIWAATFFLHSNRKTLEANFPACVPDDFEAGPLPKLSCFLQKGGEA